MASGRIAAGQRIDSAISARAWNRAQDAADLVLTNRDTLLAGAKVGVEKASNVLLVVNQTGLPVPVGGCLRLGSLLIEPGTGELDAAEPSETDLRAREFVRRPIMTGGVVQSVADTIAVALEPVGVGGVGRFAVGGVFPCKIRVLNSSHKYATGRVADVTQLVSASCGPVRILTPRGAVGPDDDETTAVWSLGQM